MISENFDQISQGYSGNAQKQQLKTAILYSALSLKDSVSRRLKLTWQLKQNWMNQPAINLVLEIAKKCSSLDSYFEFILLQSSVLMLLFNFTVDWGEVKTAPNFL